MNGMTCAYRWMGLIACVGKRHFELLPNPTMLEMFQFCLSYTMKIPDSRSNFCYIISNLEANPKQLFLAQGTDLSRRESRRSNKTTGRNLRKNGTGLYMLSKETLVGALMPWKTREYSVWIH